MKINFQVVIILLLLHVVSLNVLAQNEVLTPVRLQLKWKHQFQFAGYYAAKQQGYYQAAGLEVEMIEAKFGEDASEAVFEGEAEFGVCTSDIVMMRDQGKEAVLLASIFQHSPQVLIASDSSGIRYAQDLIGKKVAIEPNAADILAYMNDEGVLLSECIVYPHKYGVDDLIDGNIDAMSAYITDEPYLLKNRLLSYSVISPSMGGIDFYGDVLFTTKSLIDHQPKLVADFRSASLKGWEYAIAHPNEIIQLILSEYSQRHTKEHLEFEAHQMNRLILPDVVEIGYSNPGRWAQILAIYKKLNMADDMASNEGLFYSEYIEPDVVVPWELIIGFSLAILLIGSATFFYYNTARKLKIVIADRDKVEAVLREREHELKSANKTKDKFYSIIAHDLRDPFTAILGYTDIAIDEIENDNNVETLEYLGIIRTSANRMLTLLNNLLSWSNAQRGHIEFLPKLFDLEEKIKENVSVIELQARRKKIVVSTQLDTKCMVFADENMISSVLHNLLSNAIKFTEKGGEISLLLDCDDDTFKVSIKDTGVGLDKEEADNIFIQEEIHTTLGTDREKGSGLGLKICQDFISRHEGAIWVESELGKGSKFVFTLPKNII